MTGFITRFTRADGGPEEDYFYWRSEEAVGHMDLFRDDDCDLYTKIEVVSEDTDEVLQRTSF